MDGWIKVHRKLLENPIFDNPQLLKMWIWCLLKAYHKPTKQLVGLQEIEIKEGEFVTGRHKGASELKVNPSTFYKHLKLLESMQMIRLKSSNKMTIIIVENWGKYQIDEIEKYQQSNNKRTTKEQQNNTNKNIKNDKNEKNNKYIVECIDYLNKKAGTKYKYTSDKNNSLINARLEDGYTVDDIKKVIDIKCDEWLNTDMDKYLRPETLFNKTKFENYVNQKEGGKFGRSKQINFELPRKDTEDCSTEEIERECRELGLI